MHNAELAVTPPQPQHHSLLQRLLDGGDEHAFAPSVLEIQNRPPAPLARTIVITLMAATLMAVLWSIVATFEVVVSAPGKVVPSGRVKVVQPLEAGVVKAIHVRDGQRVKAGEVLIELDTTATMADSNRLAREVMEARIESRRLVALSEGKSAMTDIPADADPVLVRNQEMLLKSRMAEQHQKIAALHQEIAKKQAERAAVDASVKKLDTTLPMLEQRLRMKEELAKDAYLSEMAVIESRLEVTGQKNDLVSQRARMREATAALTAAEQNLRQAEAEFRSKIWGELTEANKRLQAAVQELVKAEQKGQLQTLRAPADGTVQQLAVNTVGGVVTAAQPLLTVVPAGTTFEVEAQVLNKDIGFLKPGQTAVVKMDAFEYTKYGYLEGKIQWVGNDAVQDQKLGLVYPVRIQVNASELPNEVNGRRPVISAGMSVTADIAVASRKAWEYFMGPLLRYKSEALRER